MKLGLGTVQFGQAYGVSNTRGRVPAQDVAAILERAAAGGVRVLDTAANYGEAENALAANDLTPFRIVTKTSPPGHWAGSTCCWSMRPPTFWVLEATISGPHCES
jgi:aryl-alcohol dehydrogenase-like predicted oxidoreductase